MTIAPKKEAFTKAVAAVARSWRARGGNPDVMGELPRVAKHHGFEIDHLDVQQRIGRPNTSMWHWPWTFFNAFLPKLVEMGQLSREECDAALKELASISDDETAFVLLPPVFEMIASKV
jgi:hypothetical protein